MNGITEYLVPDYYPDFSCKMGACRSACCVGWPVSVTMDDYFSLLGVECSEELRKNIDIALHISNDPHPEDYAQITPRYDGDCRLRLPDGRCGLQAELGESVLPAVCRLYPRGIRTSEGNECSCANSCERVLELLYAQKSPIEFIKRPIALDIPAVSKTNFHFETAGREQEIRLHFIKLIQCREYPLPIRLIFLYHELCEMDDALNAGNTEKVSELLSRRHAAPVIIEKLPDWAHLKLGLEAAAQMVYLFDKGSQSIRDYGNAALEYFGEGEAAFGRYAIARAHFVTIMPDWQIFFENMLINHMFFSRFPFQDRPVSLREEFIALCAVYTLLRFLGIGWMADKDDVDSFIDAAAAAFRLIDHTAFDRYAANVLGSLGCTDSEKLYELLLL